MTVFPILQSSGTLGPKRAQGDGQVPEGFYYIDRFNPWSNFHLSLGIDYPNQSDQILKTDRDPGGDIFIHGSCVTIGCIPLGDEAIEELYVLAVDTKSNGQKNIAVHIFPCRMDEPKNFNLLEKYSRDKPGLAAFWQNIKEGYMLFKNNRRIPLTKVDKEGRYLFSK